MRPGFARPDPGWGGGGWVPTSMIQTSLVWVRGAGDLATGIALRLYRAGYSVAMSELPLPTCVRRTVSFAPAVTAGRHVVEAVTAVRAATPAEVAAAIARGEVPVAVDPVGELLAACHPAAVVDAIMAKQNTGTTRQDAPMVVAVGPGFSAGMDCHAVVETQRGHWLGRVYYSGGAAPDDGEPGEMNGQRSSRVLRAPVDGTFQGSAGIGDMVTPGQVVGRVAGEPVVAAIAGVLRGLIADGVPVQADLKVGDVDPSGEVARCSAVSDKSLAVGGGVLEALLHLGCRP